MLYNNVDLSFVEPGSVVHVNTYSGWYHIGVTKNTSIVSTEENSVTGIFVTSTCEYYLHTYFRYAQDGYHTLDPGNIQMSRFIEVDNQFTVDITQGRLVKHISRPIKSIFIR